MSARTVLLTSILLSLAVIAPAAEDPDLSALLKKRGLDGSILIASLSGETTFVANEARANVRFSPASTFKIPNTLIALEEGALRDEQDTIRWDGLQRALPEWNRDHCLASAFPVSCVWFYQEIARRVGIQKYRSYLENLSYGNRETGTAADMFWLDGTLRISAVEQVDFLRKVYRRDFAFSGRSYEILQRIMIARTAPSYVLRGKTGRTGGNPDLGWYVGYAQTSRGVWFFALNIDIRSDRDPPLRKELIFEALKAKGIIP